MLTNRKSAKIIGAQFNVYAALCCSVIFLAYGVSVYLNTEEETECFIIVCAAVDSEFKVLAAVLCPFKIIAVECVFGNKRDNGFGYFVFTVFVREILFALLAIPVFNISVLG